jgi:hypothetical protein
MSTTSGSTSTAAVAMDGWSVLNTVILVIVAACAVGIAIVVLLVFVGSKRRKMAVRNQFVPVLLQAVPKRQKREILEEQQREADFAMTPPRDPNETLHGWLDERVGEALGEEAAGQVEQLAHEGWLAWREEQTRRAQQQPPPEPRVPSLCASRHPDERHLASLLAVSAALLEKHAVAVAPHLGLARPAHLDVPSYVKHLEKTLRLDKRVCDKYLALYQQARWAGPLRSSLAMADLIQMNLFLGDLVAEIDAATAA